MIEHNVVFPATVSAYMQSNARTRHIMGPWRSGKSVGSIFEIVRRAQMQARGTDGKRKTKWMVVRNTVRDLRDTTIATWNQWFPEGTIGYWHHTTLTYKIRIDDIEADVMFRALDRPEHAANLLSLEVTGFYFNEVREIEREILEKADSRIGHYPSKMEGGCTWSGIWADTNPPEEGSYLECMYESKDPDNRQDAKPNSWKVFRQPPAVIKNLASGMWEVNVGQQRGLLPAENAKNLNDPDYYLLQMRDRNDEYIRVNLGCEYGRSKGGRPVHPLFTRSLHVSRTPLIPDKNAVLVVSADFGGTPALTLKQQNAFGQVCTFDEIVTFKSNIALVIQDQLLPLIRRKYDGFEMFVTGDPSGDAASQTNGESCADIFRSYKRKGLGKVKFAYSNDPIVRQAATDNFLQKIVPGEPIKPMFLVDPSCQWYIEALGGKYFYKRHKDGRHLIEVEKNDWSHVAESGEYGDMYFERGGRRKAEQQERGRILVANEPNPYHSVR